MMIFDENSTPTILDSITTPTIAEMFWVLDMTMDDFTLTNLFVLEEIVSPTIELQVDGFHFALPASWSILVCDEETMQLDVVDIASVAGKEFKAMVYGPNYNMVEAVSVSATNYHPNYANVAPSMSKNQMLCHPISPEAWINVSPSDAYNKYLKGKVAGDFV
jgi:hypothetical protein